MDLTAPESPLKLTAIPEGRRSVHAMTGVSEGIMESGRRDQRGGSGFHGS